MTENEVVAASAAAGQGNAPSVTPERVSDVIRATHTFKLGAALRALGHPVDPAFDLLTICALKLENGFIVTGESACASPEKFNAEIGSKLAYDDARRQIWRLEGYVLKSKLAECA